MRLILTFFILLALSFPGLAKDSLSQKEIKAKAEAFIAAKNARQQPATKVEDIDNFISLLADDFKDEHIKFGVVVTDKAELRKGMIYKMKDQIEFSNIKIDQMMIGWNVAFIQYTEHARVKPSHMDKFVEYTSTNIISLEFNKDGKIKHIRRHHGL